MPGAVVGVYSGTIGVEWRRRAQGDAHHLCRDADPCWEDGACGGAAIVAVVCCHQWKVDWVFGSGERVEGARRERWDFDAVADGPAITATVDNERLLG